MTAASPIPSLPRRSPVLPDLIALGATFSPVGTGCAQAAVAETIPASAADAPVRLVDLSPLPRAGFKGLDTAAWLARQTLLGPLPGPNTASPHADGGWIVRLGPGEVLLLPDPQTGAAGWIDDLVRTWAMDDTAGVCYPVPRADSHAWFALTGPGAPDTLAMLCGVDLRPHRFAPLSVAQTTVGRVVCIVIRTDHPDANGTAAASPCYHLLADWASARSLWGYLCEAMATLGGVPAGREALG